jgi:hypothetical protein
VESRANRILTVFFMVLCAINLGYLLVGFLSIPGYYERTTTLTIQQYDLPGANHPTNESVKQGATEHGLMLSAFAIEQIVFHSGIVLLFLAVAGVIVSHARWNWFAWYSAFFLVFIAEFAVNDEVYVAHFLPLWVYVAGSLFWPLILLYFFLFPNGRPVPRKALWVIAPILLFHFAVQTTGFLSLFFPNILARPFLDIVLGPAQYLIFVAFLLLLGCQVYRYRHISTREERQQTKWFLLGFVFNIALSTLSESLGNKNPYRGEVSLLIFAFVPLSVGVAVLRYRLWDIDLIIRRTLVYGLLTAILGVLYYGGVVLIQQALRLLTGQAGQAPLGIVVSTLGIAALFNPIRSRLQNFIDRRFYRQKYDAAKALEEYSVAARREVDLDQISAGLVAVVEATMKPRIVVLRLKPFDRKRQPPKDNRQPAAIDAHPGGNP